MVIFDSNSGNNSSNTSSSSNINPSLSDVIQGHDENIPLKQEEEQLEQREQRQQRRKRRWGHAYPSTETNPNGSSIGSVSNFGGKNSGSQGTLTVTAATNPSPLIGNSSGAEVDDARARVLALKESVKARLAAARASIAVHTQPSSIPLQQAVHAVDDSHQLEKGLAAEHQVNRPKSALFLSSVPPITSEPSLIASGLSVSSINNVSNRSMQLDHENQPSLKKARHYELDLTVTAPSFRSSSLSVNAKAGSGLTLESNIGDKSGKNQHSVYPMNPSNPYLAHREKESNNPATPLCDDGSSRIVSKDSGSTVQNNDISDPQLMVRASKPRVRNKEFTFVEPGWWQERATKIRASQAKIVESGYLSGRKKGHTVQGATMMYYASGGSGIGSEDDIHCELQQQLPPRADANPTNAHQHLPSIMEWWDIDLLPPNLRKQVVALEKEKDDVNKSKLVPKKIASTKKNEDDNNRKNDGSYEMTGADLATHKEFPQDLEYDLKMHDKTLAEELRVLCYQHASLSYCKTSDLVQHIVPIRPKINSATDGTTATSDPSAQDKKTGILFYLTKKELKRQRKLRRQEKQRELQDLQAAGLIQAPEPRLTLRNFFQVLGDTAVTDPSQIEQTVQQQIQLRQQQHLERNEAKKLTKEQRSLKKQQQLNSQDNAAAASQQINVALFYVYDISHPYHRTKVDLNAQQLNLTGGVVECKLNHHEISANVDPVNCVIVEGNPRSIAKFVRLMTVRMKWSEADENDEDDEGYAIDKECIVEGSDTPPLKSRKFNPNNFCELVWKGLIVKRNFHGFLFQEFDTENQARKIFRARGIENYWDQIVQRASTGRKGISSMFKLYSNDDLDGEIDANDKSLQLEPKDRCDDVFMEDVG